MGLNNFQFQNMINHGFQSLKIQFCFVSVEFSVSEGPELGERKTWWVRDN